MLVAALIAILAVICMARKGGRRPNWSKYLSGAVNSSVELTALAAKTLTGTNLSQTVADVTRVSSVKATWSLNNVTPGAGIGPVLVGYAHSNYTNAEVEAYIEAASSWDMGDMTAKEVRIRRVRIVGTLNTPDAIGESTYLNHGRPVKTKLNWVLAEGDTIKVWGYNLGSAAFATTAPSVLTFGTASLWQM